MYIKLQENGQIALPSQILEQCSLTTGHLLECCVKDGGILLMPAKLHRVERSFPLHS